YDTGRKTQLWKADTGSETERFGYYRPLVVTTPESIWLQQGSEFSQLDRQTGEKKATVKIDGYVSGVMQSEASLVVNSIVVDAGAEAEAQAAVTQMAQKLQATAGGSTNQPP